MYKFRFLQEKKIKTKVVLVNMTSTCPKKRQVMLVNTTFTC